MSGKFPRTEIKLFQTDVDKRWNNFEIICCGLLIHNNRTTIDNKWAVGAQGIR